MARSHDKARRARPPLDLLHHGLAGALLGFPLAIWASGTLVYYAAGAAHDSAAYQLTMWVVPLLWVGVITLALFAPTRRACWAGLLAGNALAFGLLKVVQA